MGPVRENKASRAYKFQHLPEAAHGLHLIQVSSVSGVSKLVLSPVCIFPLLMLNSILRFQEFQLVRLPGDTGMYGGSVGRG